jgi:hypothetical protein
LYKNNIGKGTIYRTQHSPEFAKFCPYRLPPKSTQTNTSKYRLQWDFEDKIDDTNTCLLILRLSDSLTDGELNQIQSFVDFATRNKFSFAKPFLYALMLFSSSYDIHILFLKFCIFFSITHCFIDRIFQLIFGDFFMRCSNYVDIQF